MLARMTRAAVTPTVGRRKTRLERISRRRCTRSLSGLPGVVRLESDILMVVVKPTMRLHRLRPPLAAGPRDHGVGRKHVYPGASLPTTIPSQDVNPGLPNICAAPPSAAPDTDVGLPIVGTLNLSAIGPHAVYALYFRLSDLSWPSQSPTADPKPAIEDELESNGECDVEKIVRKEWVLVDGGYEPRYLVRWKGWGKEHDELHGLDDLENSMELVNAFDNKHPRSREPPRRKA